jgi:putative ABC transport system permease protein
MWAAIVRGVSRLVAVFRHRTDDAELDEEMASHRSLLVDDYLRRGLSDDEARRAAHVMLGNATQLREAHRRVRGLSQAEDLIGDLRYALRSCARQPGFTCIVMATLAIGIGANTAIFSVVRTVLLEPRPYADADRLVTLNERWPRLPGPRPVSMLNYQDWAGQSTVFDGIAAVSWGSVTVGGAGEAVYVNGSTVSPAYFDVFGLHAALGRTFAPDEDQPSRDRVAVLGHRLWTTQFGANPAIVGTTIRLDGESYTVIGVMPPRTSVEFLDPQIWRPLTFNTLPPRGSRVLRQVVAKLKPGISLEQARAEMQLIAERLATEYPDANRDYGVVVQPLARPIGLDVEASLYLLSGAAAVVLLIACINLAALALTRGAARAREAAIRLALGGPRGRLMRQFLIEHLVLGVFGGLAGIFAGYVLVSAMKTAIPTTGLRAAFPPDTQIAIDGWVWLFAVALSVMSGLSFGVAPTIAATRQSLTGVLTSGGVTRAGWSRGRSRRLLVAAQIAGAFVLVASAAVLVRGLVALTARVESGFDSTNVLTAGLPTPVIRFQSAAALNAHLDEIGRRVQSLPAIRDVAFTDSLPTQGAPYLTRFQIVGQPAGAFLRRPLGGFKVVSPSYFRAVGLRLLSGRPLADADREDAPFVVVVNETLARTFFPGTSPVGERLLMRRIPLEASTSAAGPARRASVTADVEWTIVGVIADEGVDPFDDRVAEPTVYATREQHPRGNLTLVVRTESDPSRMQEAIRKTVSAFDPDQALADLQPLARLVPADVAPDRLRSLLVAAFAAIALSLAALGLYGVVAHTVAQRTREIGIRVALGASRLDVGVLVMRQTMVVVAIGLAAGVVLALIVSPALKAFLYGVPVANVASYAAVAGVLAGVAAIACYLPARHATRIDPLRALRVD